MILYIIIFVVIILIYLKLKLKDPKIPVGVKIFHYFVLFLYYIMGIYSGKINRKVTNFFNQIPQTGERKGIKTTDISFKNIYDEEKTVKVRLFEKIISKKEKKPLLIYIHGKLLI